MSSGPHNRNRNKYGKHRYKIRLFKRRKYILTVVQIQASDVVSLERIRLCVLSDRTAGESASTIAVLS